MGIRKQIIAVISVLIVTVTVINAQKVYPVTSGEVIFSLADIQFKQSFIDEYPDAELTSNNLRLTLFFHLGEYIHWDMTNNVGLITGIGIRNVGLITDEVLPVHVGNQELYKNYKIIRREYYTGIPLALKLGSFSDHIFFFGGVEYEFALHFKEKYWENHKRSGTKYKNSDWFSGKSPAFVPSVFGGVQMPGGVHVKFKYYLDNFLNDSYTVSRNSEEGADFSVSDLSRYEKSTIFYISVSWQLSDIYVSKKDWRKADEVAYNYH
ncbi:MAG: hypothetical protein JW894_11525 [Bacteroidales bacterium]|nr:hypothetical protein [Bacteroidales bacterium]